ncbi:MAG: TlyA family RNA methyltransferase [Syntrophales bacterium LBB04]|nr:TlyA family RNA methyltransferase [Syntrophales bacterium LBB04]
MTVKIKKNRLDKLLVSRNICSTREKARALIMSAIVLLGENRMDKAGSLVSSDADVRIKGENNPYASRGGLKLKGALREFELDVNDMIAIDVGASTGGFTDCLLQEGAAKVYAIDVGYGQLAWKLRTDKRVVCIERTNIRYYDGFGIVNPIDIATIDASFISLKLVIPAVLKLLKKNNAIMIALIKPQFEAGRGWIEKHGVVKNPEVHKHVIDEIQEYCVGLGLTVAGTCESLLMGPKGNKEFFIFLKIPSLIKSQTT